MRNERRFGIGRGGHFEIIRHNQQIMLAAVAVFDVIAQRRFVMKTQ